MIGQLDDGLGWKLAENDERKFKWIFPLCDKKKQGHESGWKEKNQIRRKKMIIIG
jgi:hypothetical protein